MKKRGHIPCDKVKFVVFISGSRFAAHASPRRLCESIGGARCVFDLEHFDISANCYIILYIYRGYPHDLQANLTTAHLLICKRYCSNTSNIERPCTQSPGLLTQSTQGPTVQGDLKSTATATIHTRDRRRRRARRDPAEGRCRRRC